MSLAEAVRDRIVRAIDDEQLGAYGLHVLVGHESARHRWRSDDRVNLYSVSKGVSALAAGIAIDEGVLSLDTRAVDVLAVPERGAGVERVTLRHLLTMTSGIDFEWFGDQEVPWPDLAVEMLSRPSRGAGERFQYSDASTYVAMRMLGAAVGDVREWLMPRLFQPLGIHNPQWLRCPLGWIVGGSGLELRTEELARIGRVLRDGGRFGEQSIVSERWIDRMHSEWVSSGAGGLYSSYGLAAWRGPHNGWRLDGRYGQYVFIDDAADAVVTITAHEEKSDQRLVEIAADAVAEALSGDGLSGDGVSGDGLSGDGVSGDAGSSR
ncbi:serine hydrolase domain-containing protein [Microbacterium sp. NPDC088619]|uniref:serine hydrolase domain-containing protein n=1 Tax=Microbacterium sp. NPDC088619 TaxID=3364196 RepID=UPI00381E8F49